MLDRFNNYTKHYDLFFFTASLLRPSYFNPSIFLLSFHVPSIFPSPLLPYCMWQWLFLTLFLWSTYHYEYVWGVTEKTQAWWSHRSPEFLHVDGVVFLYKLTEWIRYNCRVTYRYFKREKISVTLWNEWIMNYTIPTLCYLNDSAGLLLTGFIVGLQLLSLMKLNLNHLLIFKTFKQLGNFLLLKGWA